MLAPGLNCVGVFFPLIFGERLNPQVHYSLSPGCDPTSGSAKLLGCRLWAVGLTPLMEGQSWGSPTRGLSSEGLTAGVWGSFSVIPEAEGDS